ncbi:MAG TPA: hypothetical protein VLF69_05000 [Candidatus Saccharimonadales bacterium]|nr:hypothetical protein [Candidatus Saccharimonadales bacterium]
MTNKDLDRHEVKSIADTTAVAQLGAGALNDTEVVTGPRGLRKEHLNNGEARIAGAVFTTPDPEVMEPILQEGGGKVHYLPAKEFDSPWELNGGAPAFHQAVMVPLCQEILATYGDRPVALRAIMTSVNGRLTDVWQTTTGSAEMLDITETVAAGTEKNNSSFNVQGMYSGGTAEEAAAGAKYIAKYAGGVGMEVKYEVDDPAHRDAIFPAVLVYAADQLEPTGEDRFTVRFRDGVDPQGAVLGAYVLDRMS